jgi:hypothetical protein
MELRTHEEFARGVLYLATARARGDLDAAADAWQIAAVLGDFLVTDLDTIRGFTRTLGGIVEGLIREHQPTPAAPPPTTPPPVNAKPHSIDQILERATRERDLVDQERQIEDRLRARWSSVVEAIRGFSATLPGGSVPGSDQVESAAEGAVVADALLKLCQAVRDGLFTRGMTDILNGDGDDAPANDRLATELYRRAWSNDRQGVIDLVDRVSRLPNLPDHRDPAVPSPGGVCQAVRAKFYSIMPWPSFGAIHAWHPDLIEAWQLRSRFSPQQHETEPMPCRSSVEVQTSPSAPGTSTVLGQESERINQLHALAVRCANVVLRLEHLRQCGDGERHARAALIDLQQAVADLPDLPLGNDPFCGDDIVDVAGVRGTSTHVALLQVARLTWEAAHITRLADGNTTTHQDPSGEPFTRVTFRNVRLPPTEVEWTADVWREVSDGLGQLPSLELDLVQAALALEHNRAARRLEDRFGVLITDLQTIALKTAEITPPSVIPTQMAEDNGDQLQQPAEVQPMARQSSGSGPTMKQPSKDAIAAYRLWFLTGKTQTELAEQLTEELKRPITQGTVSRWLKQVKAWLKAGNVLPDLTPTRHPKPQPMDPERIDLGERQDGRARRQRGRRNSDHDD